MAYTISLIPKGSFGSNSYKNNSNQPLWGNARFGIQCGTAALRATRNNLSGQILELQFNI